ncbi:MAG: hypothetical protein OEO19_18995 [Gammaproteobacteria bacterium]|nr:hypothetical protein [Gammaproteobacteria bacterium]MDH3450453.1 hypothetical protein [Gammaproteobacteria bacterium]
MRHLKSQLIRLLVIISLALPWATADALETFERAGVITGVGYDKFTLDNEEYRISPGATLRSSDPNRKKFADFKKGDQIYFKGKILNGVNYVDSIVYLVPLPS